MEKGKNFVNCTYGAYASYHASTLQRTILYDIVICLLGLSRFFFIIYTYKLNLQNRLIDNQRNILNNVGCPYLHSKPLERSK